VTLGSPLGADIINDRIETLKYLGFNVVVGQYVYADNGFIAGTDEQRASDLMAMFADDRVKMILTTRSGVGIAGILPYLDNGFIVITDEQRESNLMSMFADD